MKNYFVIIATLVSGLVFFSFVQKPVEKNVFASQDQSNTIPDSIQKIFNNSCIECHSESGTFKAKLKWKNEELSTMKTYKFAGLVSDMEKVIKKGKMPPSRYIRKNPDKKLTKEEKKMLLSWTDKTISEFSE